MEEKQILEEYIKTHIPLTGCMGVRVDQVGPRRVALAAPLLPNLNHQGTFFGGSGAALAMLASWGLTWLFVHREGLHASVVVRRHSMEFIRPMTAPVLAVCELIHAEPQASFIADLLRKGKSRLQLSTTLLVNDIVCATSSGEFVALARTD